MKNLLYKFLPGYIAVYKTVCFQYIHCLVAKVIHAKIIIT
jgi:hypothetical protein